MLPSSHHPNLTPMGTVPISVIYGFEYPLNGSESRTKTRGESLHTSGENKKINPLPSVASVRKTKGCLSNLQRPQKRTATGINQQYFPLKMCINIQGESKRTGISNQKPAWKAWCCESCLTSLPLPTGPYLTLYSNIIVSTSPIDMNENMKRNHKDIEWKQLFFEIPVFFLLTL